MLAEREGRVDTIGGVRFGGLSWKVLVLESGRWVRTREVKEALRVRVLRALRELRERSRVEILGGIVDGSWARFLMGEDLGGGVGGRCIRSGFRRGITRGEPLVELVLFWDLEELSGLWRLMSIPVLLLLSLLSFLSVMTGCVPAVFGGSAMVLSNECESDANDASSNSPLSGEAGLCWGVSERIDEVTVLGGGETTPNVTS